jgi:hypothetical protein
MSISVIGMYSKKGLIILSHYRSGGTQFRRMVVGGLEESNILNKQIEDFGEVNFEDYDDKPETIIDAFFKLDSNKFRVIQLNNALVLAYMLANGIFDKILDNFDLVTVMRKDKTKCLLSLPLWEKFIQSGLNDSNTLWTKENMLDFHNKLLAKPIEWNTIYNGVYHENLHTDKPSEYLDKKILFFINSLSTLRHISKKYNSKIIFYEDYEFNKNYIVENYFLSFFGLFNIQKIVNDTYLWKIPYISNNYIDYFDSHVKKAFKEWGIN